MPQNADAKHSSFISNFPPTSQVGTPVTVVVAALKDDTAMTDLSMNPEGSTSDGNGGVTAMAGRVQMSLYGLDGAPIVAAWCLQRSYPPGD